MSRRFLNDEWIEFPPVVVLCGSTRYRREFEDAEEAFTHNGEVVLTVGSFPHADARRIEDDFAHRLIDPALAPPGDKEKRYGEEKTRLLDELHRWKIYLADRVFVINPRTGEHPEGYLGSSTTAEIEYAKKLGKPITYLFTPADC